MARQDDDDDDTQNIPITSFPIAESTRIEIFYYGANLGATYHSKAGIKNVPLLQ